VFPSPGVDIDHAIETLRDLARSVGNIDNPPPSLGVEGIGARRDEYLAWVDMAEPRLMSVFGPNVLPSLHNDSYRQIWSMDIHGPRPIALVNNEAARQRRHLDALATELEKRQAPFNGGEAIFVVDTNVFLHYHTLNQPKRWRGEALQPDSLVIVPLRVIQELDLKKQSANKPLAKRARDRLRRLNEVLEEELVGLVGEGLTLRVVVEPDVYDQQADEEVLNVASRVQAYARRVVTVLTGDLSMQLRARAYGLQSVAMPETLRLELDDSEGEPNTETAP